jgi:hypothetical protein
MYLIENLQLQLAITVMFTRLLTILLDLWERFDLERGLGDDPEAALRAENHLIDVRSD